MLDVSVFGAEERTLNSTTVRPQARQAQQVRSISQRTQDYRGPLSFSSAVRGRLRTRCRDFPADSCRCGWLSPLTTWGNLRTSTGGRASRSDLRAVRRRELASVTTGPTDCHH
jgi:hypothetical protein